MTPIEEKIKYLDEGDPQTAKDAMDDNYIRVHIQNVKTLLEETIKEILPPKASHLKEGWQHEAGEELKEQCVLCSDDQSFNKCRNTAILKARELGLNLE